MFSENTNIGCSRKYRFLLFLSFEKRVAYVNRAFFCGYSGLIFS